jgi:hypothetical protein
MDHVFQGQTREASHLASEAWALIESVGDATLTVGLSFPMIYSKLVSAEFCDARALAAAGDYRSGFTRDCLALRSLSQDLLSDEGRGQEPSEKGAKWFIISPPSSHRLGVGIMPVLWLSLPSP